MTRFFFWNPNCTHIFGLFYRCLKHFRQVLLKDRVTLWINFTWLECGNNQTIWWFLFAFLFLKEVLVLEVNCVCWVFLFFVLKKARDDKGNYLLNFITLWYKLRNSIVQRENGESHKCRSCDLTTNESFHLAYYLWHYIRRNIN